MVAGELAISNVALYATTRRERTGMRQSPRFLIGMTTSLLAVECFFTGETPGFLVASSRDRLP